MRWSFAASDARDAQGMRGAFRSYLESRGEPDGDYDGAELVFGELVGNVVRHAPGAIAIHVEWNGYAPTLLVSDRGAGFDPGAIADPDVLAESGRGLFLVRILSDAFSVSARAGGGSDVRATLRLRRRVYEVTARTTFVLATPESQALPAS